MFKNSIGFSMKSLKTKSRFSTTFLQVPSREVLTFGDDNIIKYEKTGVKQVQNAAFVLVAGGLGERLIYNGIKEKVACLADNDARLAVDPDNKYRIQASRWRPDIWSVLSSAASCLKEASTGPTPVNP